MKTGEKKKKSLVKKQGKKQDRKSGCVGGRKGGGHRTTGEGRQLEDGDRPELISN